MVLPAVLFLFSPAQADSYAVGGLDSGFLDDSEAEYGSGLSDGWDEDLEGIINGEDAAIGDYPQTGALLIDATMRYNGQSQHFRMALCSSTLIAPDVVILAAHCVDDIALTGGYGTIEDKTYKWSRQADLSAFSGTGIPDWPDDAVPASNWAQNPSFDMYQFQMGLAHNYDVALLFLDQALDTPYAYLITRQEASQVVTGTPVHIVGWGQQTSDSNPPRGTYGIKQMGESSIAEINQWEFQVGAQTSDVRKCHGDSGGPTFMDVVTDSPERMREIGITSHSYDSSDCRRTGGVDTRIDAYLDWIDEEMTRRCVSGERAWCDVQGIIPPPDPPLPEDSASGEGEGEGDDNADDDGKFGICSCAAAGRPLAGGLGLALVGLILGWRRRR